jgi:hypothetical protein
MKVRLLQVVIALTAFAGFASAQSNLPRTVRDFFMMLPAKYFDVGCCGADEKTDLKEAHRLYLEQFLRVEDTANGYLEGGCDGGQSCITMVLFKKPDTNYVVGVHTANTMYEENYFLEYRGGRWYDVASKVVPGFSRDKVYVLPRQGTTVGVFSTRVIERISSTQVIRETGSKLYDLVWKNGKFARSKVR